MSLFFGVMSFWSGEEYWKSSILEPKPQRTPGTFGDYELLEVIGRGGMGVVYKARQVSLNRMIALKMLNSNTASFPQVAERLCLEAEVAASLHHPNIVTIHDFGEIDWEEFYSVVRGEGPVAKERMEARRKAWEDGAWVRDAAAAHEEKRRARKAA